MPKKDHYVIIGNGPAGNSAADALREHDAESRITIISDERLAYYKRYQLCDYISGGNEKEKLVVRPHSEYKELGIRLRLGQRVERIDPENRVLYLKHMEKVSFTGLLLATGGTPRILPSLTRFREYLTGIKTFDDAFELKRRLKKVKKIVILGGDLISIRFIKLLLNLEKEATFIMNRDCFWPVTLNESEADAICRSLENRGIKTFLNDTLEHITKEGETYRVGMSSGKELETEMVFCFMGFIPDIDFISGSGIDTERGVLVNEFLQSNYDYIYACGDCAQIYNPELKDYWISIGWENALLQGRLAAMNLLGEHREIKPAPESVFDIEGIKIQTPWWKEL